MKIPRAVPVGDRDADLRQGMTITLSRLEAAAETVDRLRKLAMTGWTHV